MKKDGKGFSTKDVIMIVLCVLVLIVLILLLKQSGKNQKEEQAQLNQMQEEITKTGETGSSVSGKNSSYVVCNEVNQEGWLELYNAGKQEIHMQEAAIYVNGELVKTYKDEFSIPARSLVVLEAGVKLGQEENNVISLVNGEEKLFTMTFPKLAVQESYGRIGTGNDEMGYQTPTRGENNAQEVLKTEDRLTFSVPGGFYTDTITLTMTDKPGVDIYYTTDGSTPTTASEKYTAPVKIANRSGSGYVYADIVNNGYKPSGIEMGTVVRAIAVDAQGNILEEKTESYFIGIANNSDLVDLPVISLSTDAANLFDYFQGIYVQGRNYEDALASGQDGLFQANYQMDWKREAHIEFFDGNKGKSYGGDIALSILRDYSMESPQKSFYVTGDGNGAWTGSELCDYFNDVSNVLEIQTNRRDNESKAREYLVNDLLEDTQVGTQQLTPCVLFINGEYWGGYMLRKPLDRVYFEDKYAIPEDNKVILAKDGIIENYDYLNEYDRLIQFITSNDMSLESNYEQLQLQMDVQSYLDYLCANMYIANIDYGIEESYAWKTSMTGQGEYEDGRWRWIIGKTNCSMNALMADGKATSTIDSFLMPTVREDRILRALIHNETFRKQLQETMHRMAEQIFTEENVTAELDSISARIGKMAASSYGRFYAYPNTGFYQGQTERIQDFFQNRAEYMLYYVEHLEEIEDSWNAIEAPVQLQEPDEAQPQETLPQEEAPDAGQEQSQAESAENVEQSGESNGQ